MQSLDESSKHIISEALKRFIAVDSARAGVTMGEAQIREVRCVVQPNFKETYQDACVTDGENVFKLHVEEQVTQFIVHTLKIPQETWRPPLKEEDWVVCCQSLYQSTREGAWTEITKI